MKWSRLPICMGERIDCSSVSSSRGGSSPGTRMIRHRRDWQRSVSARTKLIWIETPTNPLLQIIDIEAVEQLRTAPATWLVVDNTFASPYLQQPLRLGADLVVHSTTKYIGGHSDVVGGAIIGSKKLLEPVYFYQNAAGAVPGPFDAFLTLRGVKTLPVRMDRHSDNALALADWLAEHPAVERVYYPGLKDHPGHKIAERQMRSFGGMISVRLRGGQDAALISSPDASIQPGGKSRRR